MLAITSASLLNYVPENLHPNPLEADMQDIQWQIVNQKEILNSNLNNSTIKASNSFTTAKDSMPLLYKINTPTSTKRKADDQNELHAIKKLKTFHISSIDAIK